MEVHEFRRQKDKFLKESPHSPLNEAVKENFAGLDYFPENEEFIVPARLELLPGEIVALETNTGEAQPYVRHAIAHFVLGGKPCRLTLFVPAYSGEAREFLVPFRDATSGSETYGAGRYLQASVEKDGTAVLDFNYAYNPFCAYSDRYRCPLPPPENYLTVPIHAGEKSFKR